MALPVLKVRKYGSSGAYTDLIPYLAHQGLKWSRNDIDSSDAGRDQTGTLHRARVAKKARLDCTCRPLIQSEMVSVLSALQYEWLQVQFTDPESGNTRTAKMYSNNIPAGFLLKKDTINYWTGITFPLIEE